MTVTPSGEPALTDDERTYLEAMAGFVRSAAGDVRAQIEDARPVITAAWGAPAADVYIAGSLSVVDWLEQYARALDTASREGR